MKYIIHNKQLIQPESQQVFFEEEVQKKVKGLEEILRDYPRELTLELFLKTEGNQPESRVYDMSVVLPLKSKELVVAGQGRKALLLGNELLDKLRYQVKEQLVLERKEHLFRRKRRQAEKLHQRVETLTSHKKARNRQAFTEVLATDLPVIRNYIGRRLALATDHLGKTRALQPEELADEVYLRIYQLFNFKPDIARHLLPWMYQIADEVLEEQLRELAFASEQVSGLDKIARAELRGLEEKFTAGADAGLLLLDELDDPSYPQPYYPADIILQDEGPDHNPEEEGSLLAEAAGQLNQEQAHQVISAALARLPAHSRTVFDLHWLEGLEPAEISYMKSIPVGEVEAILAEGRRLIVDQLVHQEKA